MDEEERKKILKAFMDKFNVVRRGDVVLRDETLEELLPAGEYEIEAILYIKRSEV